MEVFLLLVPRSQQSKERSSTIGIRVRMGVDVKKEFVEHKVQDNAVQGSRKQL